MYILAIFAGTLTTLSMIINSTLAKKTSLLQSTLINYIVGLIFSIITFLCIGNTIKLSSIQFKNIPMYMFLGGLMGAVIVYISNMIIPKIPVFRSMILLFIGQVTASIIIDFILNGNIEINKIAGALIVTLGLLYNSRIDKKLSNDI